MGWGLGSILGSVAQIGGSILGFAGNQSAANAATSANAAARQATEEAKQRGIAAIKAGTEKYASTVAPQLQFNPVGLTTYRGLTQAQQIGLDDLRRNGRATLAASGLRGAGRAGVASILDAERRYIANAADRSDAEQRSAYRQEQGDVDRAQSGLAQIYAQEGGAIANTEIGAGNSLANSISADGRINANATTANAALAGEAMGGLASLIADSAKSTNWDKYRTTSAGI